MELYVTRHGQTEWNALHKVCGLTDVELTETGLLQAHQMAEQAAKLPISQVLCSPLKRARQTAEIAAEALGVSCRIEERLREIDYGSFEGADRGSEAFLNAKRQFAFCYPGGESILQVAHRVYGLLDELCCQQETFLLVAHNGICRVIHCYFNDLTNDGYFHFNYDNCQLRQYCFSR